ncbi:hypothetical protein [uncultured Prevotella sp.]|uniref:hypothetical protein n=1 Tax=uncultured Prevotella sp. TaxID=159272 RepID=UPI0025F50D13|nr:hypothetical protein [uncultured Prevotella sp.]
MSDDIKPQNLRNPAATKFDGVSEFQSTHPRRVRRPTHTPENEVTVVSIHAPT